MTLLHILWKDLRGSLRSPFVMAFLLVLPLAQAGLPYLAFRGFSREPKLEPVRLAIANLDRPVAAYPDFVAGAMLMEMYRDPSLVEMFLIAESVSEADARARVDAGLADVALVVPEEFTAAIFDPSRKVTVRLYADPAKTFAPRLTHEVAVNFLDGFSGAQMAAEVARARNGALSDSQRLDVMTRYGDWAQSVGEALVRGRHPAIAYEGMEGATNPGLTMDALIGPMLAGMLVFFGFFVAGICALSFLRERERGTLHRLLTTSASLGSVLAGKAGAVACVLAVQAAALLALGAALFGIEWGNPWKVSVAVIGFLICGTGFGTLLVSFLRTSRQAFLILGGAIVLTSMAGGTMTTTFTQLPAFMGIVRLFTPQGWVMRSFESAMADGSLLETALSAGVAAGIGAVCLWIGCANIRRQIA